jgi:Protein of unknown function, DUF547
MSWKLNTRIGLVVLALAGSFSSYSRAKESAKAGFDFSDYGAVLKAFVNDKSMVSYEKLKARPQRLEAFVSAVGKLEPSRYEKWDRKDKIAFWLNVYNGLTLKAIIDHYPIKASFFKSLIYPKNSIRQIPGVWDKIRFDVMGQDLTLGHIEHKILRVKFAEPRIHMAMVCAAMGCPPLRNEPYVGAKLDEQLDDQARRFLANPAKFRIDRGEGRLYLSPIFKWFAEDFVKHYAPKSNVAGHDRQESAVLNFIASYLPEADKNYVLGGKYDVKYLKYDWSLNEQQTGK